MPRGLRHGCRYLNQGGLVYGHLCVYASFTLMVAVLSTIPVVNELLTSVDLCPTLAYAATGLIPHARGYFSLHGVGRSPSYRMCGRP